MFLFRRLDGTYPDNKLFCTYLHTLTSSRELLYCDFLKFESLFFKEIYKYIEYLQFV